MLVVRLIPPRRAPRARPIPKDALLFTFIVRSSSPLDDGGSIKLQQHAAPLFPALHSPCGVGLSRCQHVASQRLTPFRRQPSYDTCTTGHEQRAGRRRR